MAFTAQKVVFPYSEALPAAAALWRLASTIDTSENTRQKVAATALDGWQGRFANNFVTSMDNSAKSANDVIGALRQAAANLARAWADAQHQQQTYIYYALVQYKRDHRSGWDQFTSFFTGDDTNYGSAPGAPEIPAPPSFGPTFVPQASVPGLHVWPELV